MRPKNFFLASNWAGLLGYCLWQTRRLPWFSFRLRRVKVAPF